MRVLVSTTSGAHPFGALVPFSRACAPAEADVMVAAPDCLVETHADDIDHRIDRLSATLAALRPNAGPRWSATP